MNPLQQHLSDTAAHLSAQLCELNELRERVRNTLRSAPKPPQPRQWNGHSAISRPPPEMDGEPALSQH
jgi:hypothetical protein